MKKNRIIIMGFIFLILLNSISCKKEVPQVTREELQQAGGIPVEVLTVKKGDMEITINVSGELKSDEKATINTSNTGTIEQVLVKEGDYVKARQLVAVIEANDIEDQIIQAKAAINSAVLKLTQSQSRATIQSVQVEATIKQAEASIDAAQAQYNQALLGVQTAKEQKSIVDEGARSQEIEQAKEAIASAEANLRQAELDLGRMKRLLVKGAIAQQQMDQAQLQYDVSKAQYNTACQKLALVKEGARIQERETAQQQVEIAEEKAQAALSALEQARQSLNIALSNRAQISIANEEVSVNQTAVTQAKENLDILERKLEKCYIKSPISGYITQRYVNPGEMASGPGSIKIMDVYNPDLLYFEAIVSDTDIGKIKPKMNVNITIDGVKDRKFSGNILEIIPQASSQSRQFAVKVTIRNKTGDELKPGMFARGNILLETHKNVIVVPKIAIEEKQNKNFVFIINNGKVGIKDIITGPAMGEHIEISQGLNVGEKIVAAGTVKEGDTVKIVREN